MTQDGKTLQFYDDLIKDKIFVISFLFTSCKDVCPLATSRLAELQDKLGDSMGRDIFFYSISIDPEADTPERLKGYANAFRAGPGWLFLTGKPEDIHAIRHKLGERSRVLERPSQRGSARQRGHGRVGPQLRARRSRQPGVGGARHGPEVAGRCGRRAHEPQDRPLRPCIAAWPGPLQEAVRRMPYGWTRRPGRTGSGWLDGTKGTCLAGKLHLRPEKMRAQQDPVALALAAKFPAVRMPAMGVSDADATDLLAYIAHLETRHAKRARPLESLFALTTHRGERLAPEFVKGQAVAVVFGFTHCPDVCPTALLDWSNVLASLGADGDRLKVLFVSVDSERDTPAALSAYMGSFDPRIVALTGSPTEIAGAAAAFEAFYEKVTDGSGVTFDHSVKTYLIGRDGRLAASVDLRTPDSERRKVLDALLAER